MIWLERAAESVDCDAIRRLLRRPRVNQPACRRGSRCDSHRESVLTASPFFMTARPTLAAPSRREACNGIGSSTRFRRCRVLRFAANHPHCQIPIHEPGRA